ncbi:DUF6892 domain-containing protein [Streptomyces sp. NPDC088785]|uniref:DUF6892 domain-containing protein n=1 Tax=Streptomyces sp. NPDC088785 TaxID=3365897 RepID=UPI0038273266
MTSFTDLNFKLVVIERLMYDDRTLTPAFRLADLLKERGLGDDPWRYAYDHDLAYKIVPEAREHFAALEISDGLLASVEELTLDGGLRIYRECAPVWDGEDDLFDITVLDDLALLPNLRRISGSEFLAPDLLAVLAERGIDAD